MPTGQGAAILILEDEPVLAEAYIKKLKKAGYTAKWVKSASHLFNEVESSEPDIILLDHGLAEGEVGGIDIIPKVKKALPDAKIIVLSNYSKFDLEEKAKQSGADDYLLKINTTPNVLLKYIEKLLE